MSELIQFKSLTSFLKLKHPQGNGKWIEFINHSYVTDDPEVIEKLRKNKDIGVHEITGDEPLPPGHDLTLREKQLTEWRRQQNEKLAPSTTANASTLNVASSKEVAGDRTGHVNFKPAEVKSAMEKLKEQVALKAQETKTE